MFMSKFRNKGEGVSTDKEGTSSGGVGGGGGEDHGGTRGYRTHLIFGKRDPDGGGGAAAALGSTGQGVGGQYFGSHSTNYSYSSHSNHPFAQPQATRPPADFPPILPNRHQQHQRRISSRPEDDPYRTGIKQSNNYGGGGGQGGQGSNFEEGEGQGMLEVVAGLSRDCFIIPLACVDRFLPAGLTLPDLKSRTPNSNVVGPLHVLEVADPHLSVVVHLMTPLTPLNPSIDTPICQPERIQRSLGEQLLNKAAVERQASHGLLLNSMESNSDFPMIAIYTVPKLRTDVNHFLDISRRSALETFDASHIGYCGDHFFHLCREVATIARPPIENPAKRGKSAKTGYIISIFRVFDGDDKEKLERNWLYWTGARTLYRQLPKSVGLRRITLHKSAAPRGDKLYLLLCECTNFLDNVNSAASLLPALRARLVGYSAFYRIITCF